MLQLERQAAHQTSPRLTVQIAQTQDQIRAAQALRYKVFAEEMGAQLSSREPGIDEDLFDAYCDHLIAINDETGEVVGTYRILPPHQAKRLGSYYSDTEFDLTRLASLRPHLVEVGRSCVHPDHRNGATIALLWSGLAAYMHEHGHQYLMGCASMSMIDGGHLAASLYQKLAQNHLAPAEWRVTPRCALPMQALNRKIDAVLIWRVRMRFARSGSLLRSKASSSTSLARL